MTFCERDGMRIGWDLPITMDDGAVLRADVFLPSEEGTYPVLLTHGPYGKGLAFYDGHFKGIWESMTAAHPETAAHSSNRYQVWETPDPERWTRHGYACVRVDSRGCGKSPGVLDLLGPREVADHAACIEWAGTQDWSTGKVGLNGISYYAINQWLVASLQPPHLAAMFAFEGAADAYRDMSRHGGIMTSFWRLLHDTQIATVQHGLGPRGYSCAAQGGPVSPGNLSDEQLAANCCDLFANQLAHELDGPFYRERSARWDKVTVPFVSAGSWGGQGLHQRGNTEAFMLAASTHKYLEMHGLEHWTHFYTDYGFNLQKRFFDRFLKGDEAAWPDPPVRLQVRHPGNRFVERVEQEWPLARTSWTRLHLTPQLDLATAPPSATGEVSYGATGPGVTFLSQPFAQETEITGPASVSLTISSDTTDADLFLVLRLFGPDMKEAQFIGSQDPWTPLTMGWLRASHRKTDPDRSFAWRPWHSHDEKQPLVPGRKVTCDVELWPTSIVVPQGWRLGLSVRGNDYVAPQALPRKIFDKGRPPPNGVGAMAHNVPLDRPPELFAGTVTLHLGGQDEASLLLPVIPSPG